MIGALLGIVKNITGIFNKRSSGSNKATLTVIKTEKQLKRACDIAEQIFMLYRTQYLESCTLIEKLLHENHKNREYSRIKKLNKIILDKIIQFNKLD